MTEQFQFNIFDKEIEVCGSRPCIECAGTRNENFMKSDEPSLCRKCQGIGKETYFEPKANPHYNKKPDILTEYKYKKHVEDILKNLSVKHLEKKHLETYKEVINTYEILGGSHSLLEKLKLKVQQLETQNKKIDTYKTLYDLCLTNKKWIQNKTPQDIEKLKQANLNLKKQDDTSTQLSYYLDKNLDIIKDIQVHMMKKSIITPISPNTFVSPLPKTYDHIPNLNKAQEPILNIKPVKWNEWCQFESDNGGFVDIMSRHSQMFGQLMAEQEKIRWMKDFIQEYKKYAEHCKAQKVEPDPIPDMDVLRRRLEWITLSDGQRIYNKHYNPPSCSIM